jgi:hypothetical protein
LRISPNVVIAELTDLVAARTGLEVPVREVHFLHTQRTAS